MRRAQSALSIVLASLALAGCVTGATVNGVTPSALAPTGAGASTTGLLAPLAGGLVGRIEGLRLSGADVRSALETEYRALEYTAPGDVVPWQGQAGLVAGQVVASQPYRVGSQDCRQYTHTVTVSGLAGEQVARGTACRTEQGSWELLS